MIDSITKKVIIVKNIANRENNFVINYSFPKGGIQKGENYKEAAVRELKEETGINISEIYLREK